MLEYSTVSESRFDDVIKQLHHNFHDEPLTMSVGLCKQDTPWEFMEHHDLLALQDGLSVMAVDPSNGESPRLFNEMLEYSTVSESRFDDVIKQLHHNFHDEPLTMSVGLCKQDMPWEFMEHHDLLALQDGLSVMAVDPSNGEIAGVALNGIARRGELEKAMEELKSVDNIKYQRIWGLLHNVNKTADVFNKYNVDKVFDLRTLSVDSRYLRKGLAKELFRRSVLVAQDAGFKIMKTDAISLWTQKIAERLGFTVAESVRYHDFKNEFGQKIYDAESPHDYYKLMVKEIKPKERKIIVDNQ